MTTTIQRDFTDDAYSRQLIYLFEAVRRDIREIDEAAQALIDGQDMDAADNFIELHARHVVELLKIARRVSRAGKRARKQALKAAAQTEAAGLEQSKSVLMFDDDEGKAK